MLRMQAGNFRQRMLMLEVYSAFGQQNTKQKRPFRNPNKAKKESGRCNPVYEAETSSARERVGQLESSFEGTTQEKTCLALRTPLLRINSLYLSRTILTDNFFINSQVHHGRG